MEASTLTTAMDYPLGPVLKKYTKESGLSPSACKEHEFELKRYLYLCATHPKECLGMSGPIDNLWHLFITFTRDYHDFCRRVAGRYIHHSPNVDKDHDHSDRYEKTLELYVHEFGSPPPRHLWPSPRPIDDESNAANCGDCHDCGNDCGNDSIE